MSDELVVEKLLMLEYERIKEEQKMRIGFRDNLLYATIASIVAIIGIGYSKAASVIFLLLPPVSVVLGWTYLMNDEKISSIGRYIRTELAPQVSDASPELSPIFGWESFHRGDRHRRSRKYFQLVIDLVTFCCFPLASLIAYWTSEPEGFLAIGCSAIELLAVLYLATQIMVYADTQSA